MTLDENATKTETKAVPKQGEKEKTRQRGQKKDKVKPLTKIVVRHLPPTMTEEEFLKQVDPLPDHDFFYYATADWSLGYDATCRAYLTLKRYNDVFIFRDRFDGYVFVDSKGAEYPAIVEFAPFQGLLKNKSRRTDNKVNTIEEEPHYQQFLVKLEEDREAAVKGGECKLEFSLDRKKEEKITSTPLLQYLANKKEKRREEAKKRSEEKKRKREEEKKRQVQAQPQVTKVLSGQSAVEKSESKESVEDKSDRKNSRSKRRAERDIRRREEHEQRKKERDLEQKKSGISIESGKDGDKNDGSNDVPKPRESQQQNEDAKERRDGKRNNDRRDRNRNRKDKDKEKLKDAESKVRTSEENVKSGQSEGDKNDDINESVKNFIRTVASIQESKGLDKLPTQSSFASIAKDIVPSEVDTKNFKHKSSSSDSARKSDKGGGSAATNYADKQTHSQRQRDERRIRNKDRPSIAIYTPKPRLRLSEESDSNTSKGIRSNPTSDCEGAKKEDARPKKVSRYSERRAERRSHKEKRKSIDESDAPTEKDTQKPTANVQESAATETAAIEENQPIDA